MHAHDLILQLLARIGWGNPQEILLARALLFDLLVKLGLVILLTGMVGLERERKGRAAGLRTHMLVGLASMLVCALSSAIHEAHALGQGGMTFDMARIAAGVLTGIGFLGAGTIISRDMGPRGLTTAATIWFVSVIGIAVGFGLYAYAVVGTLAGLFVLQVLRWTEHLLRTHEIAELEISGPRAPRVVDELIHHFRAHRYRVRGVRAELDAEPNGAMRLFLQLEAWKTPDIQDVSALLKDKFPDYVCTRFQW